MKKARSVNFPLTIYTVVLYAVAYIVYLGLRISFVTKDILSFIPWQAGIALFIICFIAHMAAWVFNLLCAMKSAIHKYGERESVSFLKFKLAHAPYQILYFLICFLFVGAAANPFLMWTWLFIPLEILHSYMIMLSTSFHGVAQTLRLKRAGRISDKKAMLAIIFLFIFVLDFIGASIVAKEDKKAHQNIEINKTEVHNEN